MDGGLVSGFEVSYILRLNSLESRTNKSLRHSSIKRLFNLFNNSSSHGSTNVTCVKFISREALSSR